VPKVQATSKGTYLKSIEAKMATRSQGERERTRFAPKKEQWEKKEKFYLCKKKLERTLRRDRDNPGKEKQNWYECGGGEWQIA